MGEDILIRLKALLDRPLQCYPSPAALLDTYVILNLKIEHAPTKELLDERDELERRLRRILRGALDREKLLELLQQLIEFHREMWRMEDMVRDKGLSLEQRGAIALKADMKNDARAKLKTEINKLFRRQPGSEVKVRQV